MPQRGAQLTSEPCGVVSSGSSITTAAAFRCGRPLPDVLARVAQFTSRWAVWVALAWMVVAGLGNVAVPQLERVAAARSAACIPAGADSSVAVTRSAELFGHPTSDNLNYVVLERDQPLQPQDRRYYDTLVAALRADTKHVVAVTDLWADPLTAPLAQSQDGQATAVKI